MTEKILQNLKFWLSPKACIYKTYEDLILGDTPKEYRIFIDRGADILFVAHLDTVLLPAFRYRTKKRIYATGLDDRLGCAVASILSAELEVDLLLCDHEEQGRSTAGYHTLKEYNWICEFDREGDDVVTYDQDSKEFLTAIKTYWKVGIGSFSDICSMETDICCMNVGIGNSLPHFESSYLEKKLLRKQITKFMQFYLEYKDTKFKQDYRSSIISTSDDYFGFAQRQRAYYTSSTGYEDDICDFCGMERGDKIWDYHVCENCFEGLVEEYMYKEKV